MNVFINYADLKAVTRLAQDLQRRNPRFIQYVVKYPQRDNYNITMQVEKAKNEGAEVIWSGEELCC